MKRKDGKPKVDIGRGSLSSSAHDPALMYMEDDNRLTPLQARFIREYLVDWNATQAAARAGYSPKVCNRTGPALLKQDKIQRAIKKAIIANADAENISPAEVIQRFKQVAFFDVAALYDEYGELREIKDMPKHVRAAIKGIEERVEVDGTVIRKVKLHDSMDALEKLAKWLGMEGFDGKVKVDWNETRNVNVNVDLTSLSDKEIRLLSKIGGVDVIDADELLALPEGDAQ
jgi:phage terminase small subunit